LTPTKHLAPPGLHRSVLDKIRPQVGWAHLPQAERNHITACGIDGTHGPTVWSDLARMPGC